MFEICGMVFGIGLGTLALVFVFSMIMADMTSVKLTRKLYDFLDLMKNEKLYKNIESIRIDSEDELYIIFEKIKQLLADIENINAEKRALIKENTNLRIKLNYGADSGIMVKSSLGNGCKVIIVMRIDENT